MNSLLEKTSAAKKIDHLTITHVGPLKAFLPLWTERLQEGYFPQLHWLDLSHNNIAQKKMRSLLEALSSRELRALDLSDTKMDDNSLRTMAAQINRNGFLHLLEIDVGSNPAGDEALADFIDALALNLPGLRSLGLNNSWVAEQALSKLSFYLNNSELMAFKKLQWLFLRGIRNHSREIATVIAAASELEDLCQLDVSNTGLETPEFDWLENRWPATLTHLNLSGNSIQDSLFYLKRSIWNPEENHASFIGLEELHLSQTDLTEEGLFTLFNAQTAPYLPNLQFLYLVGMTAIPEERHWDIASDLLSIFPNLTIYFEEE